MPDPKSTIFAVVIGLVLYFFIERPTLLGKNAKTEDEAETTAVEPEVADANAAKANS